MAGVGIVGAHQGPAGEAQKEQRFGGDDHDTAAPQAVDQRPSTTQGPAERRPSDAGAHQTHDQGGQHGSAQLVAQEPVGRSRPEDEPDEQDP